ncbi:mismatch-specific DNA-glycosylase [Klenkia taihuensis]|uniref:G/U mismatch-specific uracil-DNA glycosylase n=1 Tax=Klenkia taihuensis TaxID=1225127 RepID=A0A1I1II25_9ACTN|nr:mismatch-specific DNA-glycosylase [Klenkia taihuensis]GHE08588.1 mismatch-specific DNA-glycosylase [Klenkia taihuensis]SFC35897.1 G/U mismatch-specific uracil-DNA glycosylase [Klenkia taihuensis]
MIGDEMRFTRSELLAFAGAEVPDLLPAGRVRLLFVGINPGLWTAAVRTHFARPGNRFYPALLRAGVLTEPVDAGAGMTDADRARFTAAGIGITNLVRRATARADELTPAELRDGGARLVRLVTERRPDVVAVAGVTAYRQAFGVPRARTGRQDDVPPGWPDGVQLWVVPNPSGLNAHDTLETLAAAYGEVARAAGVGSGAGGSPA